jgi:opacity protein-like surface antigen
MLKRSVVSAAVLALVLVAPQARAKDWSINFSGGMAAPVSDFKDAAKTGFVVGLGADFTAKPNVALGLDGTFVSNDASDTNPDNTAKAEILQGGGHVKYTFPMASESNLAPYLIGGLGAYNVKAKSDVFQEVSKTKFGARGGIGLMYKTSPKIGIGIESDYNWIDTSDSATNAKSTTYVGVRAGITVAMGTPASK